MSEGALVFASIIVGLAVADILASLHRLLRVRARVRWDWINLLLAGFVLLLFVQTWWGIAGQPQGSISIGRFLPSLMTLVLMFLLAAAVLPDEVPPEGFDLRSYYDENASYLWTLMTSVVGWNALSNIVSRIGEGAHPFGAFDSQAGDVMVTLLVATPIFVRRRWWHALIVAIIWLMPLLWLRRTLG